MTVAFIFFLHVGKVVASAHQVVTGQETEKTLSMQRCWGFDGNAAQLTVTRPRDSGQIWSPLLELSGALQNKVYRTCHHYGERKRMFKKAGYMQHFHLFFVEMFNFECHR
jgi:hypothetical protein